jgi:hypothetical protein
MSLHVIDRMPIRVAEIAGSGQRRLVGGAGGQPGSAAPMTTSRSKSTDGGLTWSAPQKINQTPSPGGAFTPIADVLPDGMVAVTYYDLRNNTPDPSRLDTDYFVVVSHDNAVYSVQRSVATSLRSGPKPRTRVYRHDSCLIKHRSREAAAECRNPRRQLRCGRGIALTRKRLPPPAPPRPGTSGAGPRWSPPFQRPARAWVGITRLAMSRSPSSVARAHPAAA